MLIRLWPPGLVLKTMCSFSVRLVEAIWGSPRNWIAFFDLVSLDLASLNFVSLGILSEWLVVWNLASLSFRLLILSFFWPLCYWIVSFFNFLALQFQTVLLWITGLWTLYTRILRPMIFGSLGHRFFWHSSCGATEGHAFRNGLYFRSGELYLAGAPGCRFQAPFLFYFSDTFFSVAATVFPSQRWFFCRSDDFSVAATIFDLYVLLLLNLACFEIFFAWSFFFEGLLFVRVLFSFLSQRWFFCRSDDFSVAATIFELYLFLLLNLASFSPKLRFHRCDGFSVSATFLFFGVVSFPTTGGLCDCQGPFPPSTMLVIGVVADGSPASCGFPFCQRHNSAHP